MDALVRHAHKNNCGKSEARIDRTKDGNGNVSDTCTRRRHIPGRDSDEEQQQHYGKPGDAAEISGKRKENRGGKTIDFVGHATAHSSHAEKLGAAEPCHTDHQQRRGEWPDKQTRHDEKRIDGTGSGARKQLLGCAAGPLTGEFSGGALAFLGSTPRLELIDLAIETNA